MNKMKTVHARPFKYGGKPKTGPLYGTAYFKQQITDDQVKLTEYEWEPIESRVKIPYEVEKITQRSSTFVLINLDEYLKIMKSAGYTWKGYES